MIDLNTEKIRYREFCNLQSSKIHPNNTADWLDAVCLTGEWGAKFAEEDGQIIGIWPYYLKNKRGLLYISEPPFTQFLGPILLYPENISETKKLLFEKKVLSILFDEINKIKIDFLNQQLTPELTNWLPLYWKDCTQSTNYTYTRGQLYGLTEEDLLKSYSKKARKTVCTLIKAGYTCVNAQEIKFSASDFYDLHCYCLHKLGKEISFERNLLISIVESMVSKNKGSLLVIRDASNKICAATFVIHNNKETIAINTAADHEIYGLGYFCKHNQILMATKIGGNYNAGGSMIESVESVYMKFGLTQTPYFSIRKEISKRFKIIDATLKLLKVFK